MYTKIILIGILWCIRVHRILCTYIILLYKRMIKSENMFHYYIYIHIIHLILFYPNKLICTSNAHCGCYIVRKRDDNRATLFYIIILYVPRTRVLIQFWHVRSCVTLYNVIYRILSIYRVILLLFHNLNFRERKRNTIFRHPSKIRGRYLDTIFISMLK